MTKALTPSQMRLTRVLYAHHAHLIRRLVVGLQFSNQAAERAWGKGVRMDTVVALVKAGILTQCQPTKRGLLEYHLTPEATAQLEGQKTDEPSRV